MEGGEGRRTLKRVYAKSFLRVLINVDLQLPSLNFGYI